MPHCHSARERFKLQLAVSWSFELCATWKDDASVRHPSTNVDQWQTPVWDSQSIKMAIRYETGIPTRTGNAILKVSFEKSSVRKKSCAAPIWILITHRCNSSAAIETGQWAAGWPRPFKLKHSLCCGIVLWNSWRWCRYCSWRTRPCQVLRIGLPEAVRTLSYVWFVMPMSNKRPTILMHCRYHWNNTEARYVNH